jgi:hypothetical protein
VNLALIILLFTFIWFSLGVITMYPADKYDAFSMSREIDGQLPARMPYKLEFSILLLILFWPLGLIWFIVRRFN